MSTPPKAGKPGERARDEARPDHHQSFAAGEWELSDQREPDERFGKSRSDGGAPAEQYVRAEGDGDVPDVIDDVEEDEHDPRDELEPDADRQVSVDKREQSPIESSANPAGMNRGEKPRKAPKREKSNPKPHTKTKKKASTKTSRKHSSRR